jgi:hypothetical protein
MFSMGFIMLCSCVYVKCNFNQIHSYSHFFLPSPFHLSPTTVPLLQSCHIAIFFFLGLESVCEQTMWYLSFRAWFISLNMISSSMYFLANDIIFSILLSNTPLCVCVCVYIFFIQSSVVGYLG